MANHKYTLFNEYGFNHKVGKLPLYSTLLMAKGPGSKLYIDGSEHELVSESIIQEGGDHQAHYKNDQNACTLCEQ